MKQIETGLFLLVLSMVLAGCAHQSKNDVSSHNNAPEGTVLVAGATGRTGRLIVEELLTQGYKVRVFVRNKTKAQSFFGDKVEMSVGDVRDRGSVNNAMKNIRWVFSAIGAGGSKDSGNLPQYVDYGGTKSLVEAAVVENVERFIMVSSRSAGKVDHFLNKRHNNVLIWKKKAEDFLSASKLTYTIVRPGGLSDEAGGTSRILAFAGDREDIKLRRITRADVAKTSVESLLTEASYNKTFAIVNDPDKEPQKWDEFFIGIKDIK